jgi:hypothetical protein
VLEQKLLENSIRVDKFDSGVMMSFIGLVVVFNMWWLSFVVGFVVLWFSSQ